MLYDIIYTWNLKKNTNDHMCKTEADSQIQKTKGRGMGEIQIRSMVLRDTNNYV